MPNDLAKITIFFKNTKIICIFVHFIKKLHYLCSAKINYSLN